MKFVSLFVLICVCFCSVHSYVVEWGIVTGPEIGKRTMVVNPSMWQVKNATITFPEGGAGLAYTIAGIKHVHYMQQPVKVVFKNGGIGKNNVTIYLESKKGHGINSTFTFYRH